MNLPPKLNKSALWQKLTWVIDPVKYLETAARQCPDLYAADIIGFGGKFIIVNHPEAIQEILTSNRQKLFASSQDNALLKPLVGDRSVILLEGDPHRKRRKLLLPPFHGERMETYSQSIVELTNDVFGKLNPGEEFTARDLAQSISLQTILRVVYGLADSNRYQQLRGLISEMTEVFRSPLTSAFLFFPWLQQDWGAWSPWGNFVRVREAVDKIIYAEIAERRETNNLDGEDILSMLMSARDETGQPMSDGELRDELMSLMFAGHETTATAIAWALYWVHHLPKVKAKLLDEIASLGESPDLMTISQVPYLDAVCKETLRICPVAMLTFPRVVKQSMQLLDYDLEPGSVLMGNIYSVHQREDIYPQAKQFKPERFLERQFTSGEFVPFGGGARRCIGEALAKFELKLVVATVVANHQLSLASNRPERPRRRGVTLSPANGVKMMYRGKRTSRAIAKSNVAV
ncbi:cytochrome P450 [Myxosarcina sp. GI1]|uniref:cytochrome P450 n=1 Tax=Myxosarcina sp. GI1 TaxID=1541065 RepID=UPI00055E6115|nr:cytochrome P450 [Myxosarcina sp. GI1]